MLTLLIVLIIAAFASCLYDSWTTNKCIAAGMEENGILTKHIIGKKPTPLIVYLFNWATWAVFTGISMYAFGIVGAFALIPSLAQIAGHGWAGYGNQKLLKTAKK